MKCVEDTFAITALQSGSEFEADLTMMKKFLMCTISILIFDLKAMATVIPGSAAERMSYVQEAQVWQRPPWIDAQMNFSSQLRLLDGPASKDFPSLRADQQIECQYVHQESINGRTPKFYCEIDWNGKKEKIKVKYGAQNGELYAEVAASRLLWALGFKADGVFPVRSVLCKQCPSQDPFRNPSGQPRDYFFQFAVIERKYSGVKIEQQENQGWAWDEILRGYEPQSLNNLSQSLRQQKLLMKTQRDALRLLAVFLQHADNKPEQQRLVCEGVQVNQRCEGATGLLIQDLGATFGGGSFGLLGNITQDSKMNSNEWSKVSLWKNPAQCQAFMSKSFVGSSSLVHPIVSDEGRLFLAKLLQGFISGQAGRERLSQLFRVSRADYRMAMINHPGVQQLTVQMIQIENDRWSTFFTRKVEEITTQISRCPFSIVDLR